MSKGSRVHSSGALPLAVVVSGASPDACSNVDQAGGGVVADWESQRHIVDNDV